MSSTGISRLVRPNFPLNVADRLNAQPENILIDYVGHIALCDFGLCKLNMTETETTNSESSLPLSNDSY